MNYKETLDYLYSALPMFHRIGPAAYKANLDNTYALCNALGNPEKNLKCIHVAGTNGKGSVSHMLASIFMAAGYKTGLYTSPHLVDFRERIRVNGEMVPEEWISNFVFSNKKLFEEIKPSFFEMSTVMSFCYFKEQKTDIVIFETGLGGRLDSTNVITPILSVITNIGWDHMNLLGDSLEKIAGEKAGIIKQNIPVVIGESLPETKPVFISQAKSTNSNINFAEEEFKTEQIHYNPLNEIQIINIFKDDLPYYENLEMDLTGPYQVKNICTVMQCIEVLKKINVLISEKSLRYGLKYVKKNTGLKGRWQVISKEPVIICDTAHNEDGLTQVLPMLEKIPHSKLYIVLGMVNDKEIEKVLRLFPKNAIYYFCKANIPRGLDAAILFEKAKQFGLNGIISNSVKSALESAKQIATTEDLIFIGGSTFTVAEIF